MKNKIPNKEGFWWVRFGTGKTNHIVEVTGEAPFLEIVGWDRTSNVISSIAVWQISEWVEEIKEPE